MFSKSEGAVECRLLFKAGLFYVQEILFPLYQKEFICEAHIFPESQTYLPEHINSWVKLFALAHCQLNIWIWKSCSPSQNFNQQFLSPVLCSWWITNVKISKNCSSSLETWLGEKQLSWWSSAQLWNAMPNAIKRCTCYRFEAAIQKLQYAFIYTQAIHFN